MSANPAPSKGITKGPKAVQLDRYGNPKVATVDSAPQCKSIPQK